MSQNHLVITYFGCFKLPLYILCSLYNTAPVHWLSNSVRQCNKDWIYEAACLNYPYPQKNQSALIKCMSMHKFSVYLFIHPNLMYSSKVYLFITIYQLILFYSYNYYLFNEISFVSFLHCNTQTPKFNPILKLLSMLTFWNCHQHRHRFSFYHIKWVVSDSWKLFF